MKRPPHMSAGEWAEYQQCRAEHDDLMAQIADREAQMAHDLIATYDECELDFAPVPTSEADPAHRTPPQQRSPAVRRRSRGR
ncbi:hypothetical protein [Streptomyces nodosus]|uniref:hypothetical protein n=1 Tax=Streptomyces nodosus TaxID=40318 RepID=UPI00382F760E